MPCSPRYSNWYVLFRRSRGLRSLHSGSVPVSAAPCLSSSRAHSRLASSTPTGARASSTPNSLRPARHAGCWTPSHHISRSASRIVSLDHRRSPRRRRDGLAITGRRGINRCIEAWIGYLMVQAQSSVKTGVVMAGMAAMAGLARLLAGFRSTTGGASVVPQKIEVGCERNFNQRRNAPIWIRRQAASRVGQRLFGGEQRGVRRDRRTVWLAERQRC